MADQALRKPPLGSSHGGSASARVTPAAPATRLSLRAGADAVGTLSLAFGLELPQRAKTSASVGGRHALWLHSATDVSHRNTAIIVSGPNAAEAIAAACPLDLGNTAFPVGAAARTVLGKIEIVLLRTGEEDYRVECWRSFSSYAFGMLAEGAEDAGL